MPALEFELIAPPTLPAIEPLTAESFAKLPKKKISSLWSAADGRNGQPLRERLSALTQCANHLVCVGSLHFALLRSYAVILPKLMACLGPAIFAYQLDWRYPKPFHTGMSELDASAPDVALRRAYAHAFFGCIERTPSYFSPNVQPTTSYMIALTRHLLGKQQVSVYDAWLDAVIARLTELATDPSAEPLQSFSSYPSREAWQAAVAVTHGVALPVELLDVSVEPPAKERWPSLVAATFARLSPENNPLLQPRDALIEKGIETPYSLSGVG